MRRRQFLTSSAAAAALASLGGLARAGGTSSPKRVLFVIASGGWDTSYSLDPKLDSGSVDSPEGEVTSYEGIDVLTHASRPAASTFFDKWAGATALVRGIQIRSIVHPDCMRRLLTGSTAADDPDVAAIVAAAHGGDLPVPYLVLGNEAFPGPLRGISASLGTTKQIKAVLDEPYPLPSPLASNAHVASAEDQDAIADYLAARVERERATRGARGYNAKRLDDFERALASKGLLHDAAGSLGPRGPALGLPEQLTLAVDSLQTDLAWSALTTDPSMWDSHDDNSTQAFMQEVLFSNLDALLEDLASRDGLSAGSTMLDDTVVVVTSEMTRTPKLNESGGKDHWPIAAAMVIGGGIDGGRVIGGTDDEALGRGVDLATGDVDDDAPLLATGSLVAGLLDLAGVASDDWLPDEPLALA